MAENRLKLFINLIVGNSQDRYKARYELVRFISRKLGFRLYNMNLRWHKDDDYLKVWKSFPEGNDYIHERHFTLFKLAKSVEAVPGDTVECGVLKGAGSFLILSASESTDKVHHIFDSFCGLSDPVELDKPQEERVIEWEKGDLAINMNQVKNNLAQFSNVKYYRGWIPDRFADVAGLQFSFVHIDVDLYQPTLDCLEYFYPRLSPGGMLVCDDYGSEQCPGAYRALNEFFRDKPENVGELTTGQGIVTKQHNK